jgi:hypothetical protein
MKKMKLTLPAWLWFALFTNMEPRNKWVEEKEQLGLRIIAGLERHLKSYAMKTELITQPNQFDDCALYGVHSKK